MFSLLNFFGKKPSSPLYVLMPLGYTLFLQILTGFPKPDSLIELDANEFFVRFSEELFDYPFWLQDISHVPLFFGLAWLWSWYLSPVTSFRKMFHNKAALVSFSYAAINEMIQTFIPERFPSLGDLIMNILGVSLGLLFHSILCQKFEADKLVNN